MKTFDGHNSISCSRNFIVTSGSSNIRIFNTSFYLGNENAESLSMKFEEIQDFKLENYRIQNGGALFSVAGQDLVYLYEVVLPYKTASPFDFGNMRFIM